MLNQAKFRGAPILLAGPNFGCGSSREGAVTALAALGLRCIIAESFGDIFFGNCFQNGLLPVRLPEAAVLQMAAEAQDLAEPFTIDLHRRAVVSPGGTEHGFAIDELRRTALLEGLDDIGLTLKHAGDIAAWQTADRQARPWVWGHRGPPAGGSRKPRDIAAAATCCARG